MITSPVKQACLLVPALVFACAGPSCANAQETEAQSRELPRLRQEFAENRIALQKMRVHYRNCADQSAQADFDEFVVKEAKSSGVIGLKLTRVEESTPVLQANGYPSPLRLQELHIQGGGDLYSVHHLLHRIAFFRDWIPLDFAELTVTAGKATVRFDARVVKACWDESVEISHTEPPRGLNRFDAEIASLRVELQDVHSASITVKQLADSFQPMRVVNALAAIDSDWSPEAVLISEVHFARPNLTINGVARGEAAKLAVLRSLLKSGLQTTRIDWSVSGACNAFTANTLVDALPPTKLYPLSKSIFDQRTSEFCHTAISRSPR